MSKEIDSSFQRAFENAIENSNTSSNEKNVIIECEACGSVFGKLQDFNRHLCTTNGIIQCKICKRDFLKQQDLNKHQCKTKWNWSCPVCQKTFQTQFRLKDHMNIHSEEKPYECNVCLKQFTRKLYLQRHKYVHELDKPYKCNVCVKTFSLPSGLVEHMYSHSGQRPHKCDECNKSFTRKSTLVKHRELHKSRALKVPRRHVCNKRFMPNGCDKSSKVCTCTPKKKNTKALKRRVSKKDMYKCQACSKIVFHNSSFMEHIAVHQDFKCLECDEIYANCGCFKPSMENCELVEDDLKCNLCDKQFFNENRLYKHLLSHKCMVYYLCPKDDVDKQLKSADSGCTEEDSVESVDENLTIKEEEMDIKSPKAYQELFETYVESAKMTKEVLAIDKNLVKIKEKPAIIGNEFIKDDNDTEDFKSQFILN